MLHFFCIKSMVASVGPVLWSEIHNFGNALKYIHKKTLQRNSVHRPTHAYDRITLRVNYLRYHATYCFGIEM